MLLDDAHGGGGCCVSEMRCDARGVEATNKSRETGDASASRVGATRGEKCSGAVSHRVSAVSHRVFAPLSTRFAVLLDQHERAW